LLCPRCRQGNVQVPNAIGASNAVGPGWTLTGLCLWCVRPDCQADYYAGYHMSEALKPWSWHSPFRMEQ
jgi:hypothetical protein